MRTEQCAGHDPGHRHRRHRAAAAPLALAGLLAASGAGAQFFVNQGENRLQADRATDQGTAALRDGSLKENLQTIQGYYDRLHRQLPSQRQGTDTGSADPGPAGGGPADQAPSFAGSAMQSIGATVAPAGNQGAIAKDTHRAGYRAQERNPFAPTNRMLSAGSGNRSGLVFQPLTAETRIPRMKLRGLLRQKDGTMAGLLDVEGSGVHLVREGDTVGLYDLGSNAVIRVRHIDRLQMVVEAGSLGRRFIIR